MPGPQNENNFNFEVKMAPRNAVQKSKHRTPKNGKGCEIPIVEVPLLSKHGQNQSMDFEIFKLLKGPGILRNGSYIFEFRIKSWRKNVSTMSLDNSVSNIV